MFVIVLVASLLAVVLLILFAFRPIRLGWFFQSTDDDCDNETSRNRTPPKRTPRPRRASRKTSQAVEIYDDEEL